MTHDRRGSRPRPHFGCTRVLSALNAASRQIDDVAADGEFATPTAALPAVDRDDGGQPVELRTDARPTCWAWTAGCPPCRRPGLILDGESARLRVARPVGPLGASSTQAGRLADAGWRIWPTSWSIGM